ncbi:hypothetical protein FF011L_07390 [Roseimaritima multifibrata]|uniref:Uncharacterized protein n=1 Tax=Roseimaritima multifibrata TaxID=1930274 RepID=A0A517MAU3_9BACT|nr:hypothetical protein FF011L_07390 [Roseimaritima multifibrata]
MTIQSALFDVVHSYFTESSKIAFILETAFPDRFRASVLGCLHVGTYIGVRFLGVYAPTLTGCRGCDEE